MSTPPPPLSEPVQTGMTQSRGRLVAAVMAVWALVGVLYLLSLVLNAQRFDTGFVLSPRAAFGTLMTYLPWALVSLLMMALLRRLDQSASLGKIALLLLAGAVVWLPVNLIIDGTIGDWAFQRPYRSPGLILSQANYFSVFFVAILYLVVCFSALGWLALMRWRRERERAMALAQRDIQNRLDLADLQMQALKSQLSPHFLFNSLGSVSALARSAPREQLIDTVQAIGDLLRYALRTSNERTVVLDEEIGFTQNYVRLQALRFAERFHFSLDNQAPGALLCPPFVLQTLVENAFVHAVEKVPHRTRVDASIHVKDARLVIEVCNDCHDPAPESAGLGIALTNLRRRLALLFGEQAGCTAKVVEERYCAKVEIPLEALA
ncbi:MAG: histidine kinase [Pseudomonadota bacterium]